MDAVSQELGAYSIMVLVAPVQTCFNSFMFAPQGVPTSFVITLSLWMALTFGFQVNLVLSVTPRNVGVSVRGIG